MQSSVRKEQYGAVQFLARLGRTPSEAHQLLTTAYQEDALRKAATRTCHKRFQMLGKDVYDSPKKRKLRTKSRRLSSPISSYNNDSKVCITNSNNVNEFRKNTPEKNNNPDEFENNISGESRNSEKGLECKYLNCNTEYMEEDKMDDLAENNNYTSIEKGNYITNEVNLERDTNDSKVCITDINNLEEFGKSISGNTNSLEKSGQDASEGNTNMENVENYVLADIKILNDESEHKSLDCDREYTEDDKTDVLVENLREDQNLFEEENIQNSSNFISNENCNSFYSLVNLEKDKDQFKINNFQGIAKQRAMAGPLPSASVLGLTEKTPCFFQ